MKTLITTFVVAFFVYSESWIYPSSQFHRDTPRCSPRSKLQSVGRLVSEHSSLFTNSESNTITANLNATATITSKTLRKKIRKQHFTPDVNADLSAKAINRHFTDRADQDKIGLALLLLVETHVSPAEQLSARAKAVMIAEASSGVDATIAAILFQAVLDEKIQLSYVEEILGVGVAELTESCAQMIELQANARQLLWSDPSTNRLSDEQAENCRNMLIAMALDWRVVAVILVQQVRSLTQMMDDWSAERSSLRSRETYIAGREALEVYGPLAHQLGMYQLKNEIENLGFQILYPHQYLLITEALSNRRDQQVLLLDEQMHVLKRVLAEDVDLMGNLASLVVEGRKKSPYATWRKIMRNHKRNRMDRKLLAEADQVLDAIALRVVFKVNSGGAGSRREEEEERGRSLCYHILALIHDRWSHMEFRVKDYVKSPKPNGYQALHTTALVRYHGRIVPFEVQVRTEEMHRRAEWGLAAHFLYTKATWDWILDNGRQRKEGPDDDSCEISDEHAAAAATLETPPSTDELTCSSPQEYAGWLHDKLQERRVYVFDATQGEIVGLRRGATLKDSYVPHTRVYKYDDARYHRINGRFVPSYYELKNGDVVEEHMQNRGRQLDSFTKLMHPDMRPVGV